MSDIGRLYRRGAIPGWNPKENFTSEALAIAIDHDPAPLLDALAHAVWPADIPALDVSGVVHVETRPQEYLKPEDPSTDPNLARIGYLDLVLKLSQIGGESTEVWVEVKIDAEESGDQLDVYAAHAHLRSPKPRIVGLSRKPLRDRTEDLTPVGWLPWKRLAEAIGRTSPHDPWWDYLLDFLRDEFIVRALLPNEPVDIEAVIHLLGDVNELVTRRWPGSKLIWVHRGQQASWAHKGYEAEHRLFSTGGPLTYGLMPHEGEWFWSLAIGTTNYQRVHLEIENLIAQATRAGLSQDWTRSASPDAVLERRASLREIPSLPDALDWFEQGLDELKDADMFRDFFDGLEAKQRRAVDATSGLA